MPAVVFPQEINYNSGIVFTNNSNLIFGTQDIVLPVYPNNLKCPTAGIKRSFWKSICLNFTSTFTSVTNIKLYSSGGIMGTGVNLYIGDQSLLTSSQYIAPTGIIGDTGNAMVGNHTYITSKTNFLSYVASSMKTVDSGIYYSAFRSKHAVLQIEIDTTLSDLGILASKAFTWVWDEI